MKLPRLAPFLLLSLAGSTTAGQFDYQCQIKSLAWISKEGALDTKVPPANDEIGQRFAIDRKTGVVIGGPFYSFGEPKVLAKGSKDNAFRVVWMEKAGGEAGVHFDTLSVLEYEDQPLKPFSFFAGGSHIFSGLCK